MTPEASLYLAKARDPLDQAEFMVGVRLFEAAPRTAYLAGFQAAQALLFEKSGKVFKTHKGVQGEFGRLVKDDSRAISNCAPSLAAPTTSKPLRIKAVPVPRSVQRRQRKPSPPRSALSSAWQC